MGRRRVISTASGRSPGPAWAFLMTLAVGLLLGLLLGSFLGRIIGGSGEQASPPVPPARTVMVEKTVRAPEKERPCVRALLRARLQPRLRFRLRLRSLPKRRAKHAGVLRSSYRPWRVEPGFPELRVDGVLRSSRAAIFRGSRTRVHPAAAHGIIGA